MTTPIPMTTEQRSKISYISIIFDDWLKSFDEDYEKLSDYLGHSVLDIQEKLNDLYYFTTEEE